MIVPDLLVMEKVEEIRSVVNFYLSIELGKAALNKDEKLVEEIIKLMKSKQEGE